MIENNKRRGLPKGRTNNPHGRPIGSKNKIQPPLKAALSSFLEEKFDDLNALWSELENREKISLFTALLKYVVPTAAPDAVEDTEGESAIRQTIMQLNELNNKRLQNN